MKLEKKRSRSNKSYLIGFCPFLGKYVMGILACRGPAYYTEYYLISDEEYMLSFTAPAELDKLSEEFYMRGSSERHIGGGIYGRIKEYEKSHIIDESQSEIF